MFGSVVKSFKSSIDLTLFGPCTFLLYMHQYALCMSASQWQSAHDMLVKAGECLLHLQHVLESWIQKKKKKEGRKGTSCLDWRSEVRCRLRQPGSWRSATCTQTAALLPWRWYSWYPAGTLLHRQQSLSLSPPLLCGLPWELHPPLCVLSTEKQNSKPSELKTGWMSYFPRRKTQNSYIYKIGTTPTQGK